jgi:hypothetical protein
MSAIEAEPAEWRQRRLGLVHEVFLDDERLRELVGWEGWTAVVGPLDQVAVVAQGDAGNDPDCEELHRLSAEHGGKSVWVVEF